MQATLSYAGIGSRKTPVNILDNMTQIGEWLEGEGWLLRSGGADGADWAFEYGINFDDHKEIYKAKDASILHIDHAKMFHPAWDRCSGYARRLHARNSIIMLGPKLDDPVDMVICWTPNGEITGGTGQALRIAKTEGIPVFNLAHSPVHQLIHIHEFVKGVR